MDKPKSKNYLRIISVFGVFTIILQFAAIISAQTVDITVDSESRTAVIKGTEAAAERVNLSFLGMIAGVEGFAERFSDVQTFNEVEDRLALKKMMVGEFVAENKYSSWSYTVDLRPVGKNSAAAHSSWLGDSVGVLMMDDLLPMHLSSRAGRIVINVPKGYSVHSNEKSLGENRFEAANMKNAVVYIGSNWSEVKLSPDVPGRLLFSGDWQITKEDTAAAVAEIYYEYKNFFGKEPDNRPLIAFIRFPAEARPGDWQAETRGGNITIVSAEMPFPVQSRQRMHEQLRHEMFHLWMPNSLRLSGSYDWFYEGFALYKSLKTGVKLKRITFQDFLNTLSQAKRIDSVHQQAVSMPEASKSRWNGTGSSIYARGMAVAFLMDIAMLEVSRSNSSDKILQDIYRKHSGTAVTIDGSEAVIAVIRSNPEANEIAERYILRPDNINWDTYLQMAGLKADGGRLTVNEKLSGRQRAILKALGYNR